MKSDNSESICRICLTVEIDSVWKSVFDTDEKNVKIAQKIFDISGILIDETESYPSNICESCNNILVICYNFRLKCQESDITIKSKCKVELNEFKDFECEVYLDENVSNTFDANELWNPNEKDELDSEDFLCQKNEKDGSYDDLKYSDDENDSDYTETPIKKKRSSCDEKSSIKKKQRRYCRFKNEWIKKYDCIQPGKTPKCAFCTVCNSQLSVANGGEPIIALHISRDKHKRKLKALQTTTKNIDDSIKQNDSGQQDNVDLLQPNLDLLKPEPINEYEEDKKESVDCNQTDADNEIARDYNEKYNYESDSDDCKTTKNTSIKSEENIQTSCNKNSIKTQRRYCRFKNEWIQKYGCIQPGKKATCALCTVCNSQLSVANGGEPIILRHIGTDKHLCNLKPELRKGRVFLGKRVLCAQTVEELSFIMCEICGNKYPSKRHLRRHMVYHSDVKQHECEICKKRFREVMRLRIHMRVHTGEKPYTCKFCGKRFSDYSTKIKHERVHTNERPYECPICKRAFMVNDTMKRHMMIHTGEKPYRCEICNTNFSRNTHLNVHRKSLIHKAKIQEKASR